jgi:hypothetical protein
MLIGWDAGRHGTFQAARNGGGCHQIGPMCSLVVADAGCGERQALRKGGVWLVGWRSRPTKDFDRKQRPNGVAYWCCQLKTPESGSVMPLPL